MLATVPQLVAAKIIAASPHLKTKPLPPSMKIEGSHAELLWPAVTDDDGPCKFVRAKIREIAKAVEGTKRPLLPSARSSGRAGPASSTARSAAADVSDQPGAGAARGEAAGKVK
jgi:hypothetical protein